MKIVIVIPAYNEEEFLPVTLNSLLNQSYPIDNIIIVDDGSSDGTEWVCKSFAQSYPSISYISNIKKEKRASGSKVVRAFNLGLKQVNLDNYDLIAKIDSDIGFPENYFETIVNAFKEDAKLGLYGGICTIEQNGVWVEEIVSNLDHVRGALKTYRTEAFKQMQGLRTIMGWDSIDEFLLRYNGWKVRCLSDLKVKHYRVTHSINGWYKEATLNGEVFNNLGYNILVAFISSAKRGIKKSPYIITGMISFCSYLKNRMKKPLMELDNEQKKFINKYRLKSIFSRLK